ncbi:serine/threonine protein kinase [Aetokthonos hydrillicola Thurmond2011]|jgi:serine/threonine protein kinase|uniref:Serine/threonine protein kinase n=2 Tax=Aetokthonos TaxID=1550243 RepID=A0AAP5I7J9_9CYAN|nr:serine/threonine-protein kinase [Aetokthonos hydrillicola]MBW4585824.1 serine/threonine protein kinase [Aetokthonos hydrillicola CCALA 1050]MDR9895032.1 serine/threonine protein kinase [Aetokthonos hydrillicola Thurmond2011]
MQERYRLLKQIGKGGFGTTFLVMDEGLSPPVRCVVQKFSLKNQTPEIFEQKIQQLEELGQHPQIPGLLAYFQQDDHFYLVHEFIEGTNLATLVEEAGIFSETQIWYVLESLLPVVEHISNLDIIHSDIKPENIILRSSTPLTSSWENQEDLVLVGGYYNLLTTEGGIGSPEYAAPEQVKEKPVNASDLYSLGVTCIYLLTQISPFDLFDAANNCWTWRQYLTISLSDRLGKILDKLIQRDVNLRFQLAYEAMEAMGISVKIPLLKSKSQNSYWRCTHILRGNAGLLSCVNSIDISFDGQILASVHDDKTIKLWDLNTQRMLSTLLGHTQGIRSIAFSPHEHIFATASDDKTLKLWNADTLEEIYTLLGHTGAVKSVAFSGDGQFLASGSWDKTVKLWDVKNGKEICTFTGHQLQVSAVAFSHQGRLLASASFDRTIRVWDISKSIQNRPGKTFSSILAGHAWAVLTLAFSPDDKILATGSDDNTIKLWEVDTGHVICTLLDHSWSVTTVTFSTDGQMLISGSRDKTIKLWKVSTKQKIATFSGHLDSVSAVAVSPVAQLIASASRDNTIRLWEL